VSSCPLKKGGFAVSIQPDDDFNLRAALVSELSDVLPDDRLAGVIIARHRASRRRRIAGAVGLATVFVGVGVSLGLTSAPGAPDAGHDPLRLAPYTLALPGQYHSVTPGSAPCGPGKPTPDRGAMAASVASGACLVMLLGTPFTAGSRGDPNLPRDARPVALGRYRGWLIPHGYWQPGGTTVVVERAAPGGRRQDLIITSAGLSAPATVALVSAGLS
jgi:hypothetical protein